MRTTAPAAAILLAFLTQTSVPAAPAAPQDPPYPARLDRTAIDVWLRRTAGPAPGGALLLTARSAFVRAGPAPRGRLLLRQEALGPAAAAALTGRSALVVLEVACRERTARPLRVEVHPGPALRGPARALDPALWASLDPEVEAEDFVLLACGPARRDGGAEAEPRVAVQIGAFAGEAGAQAAFRRLRDALPDETLGLAVALAPAGRNGRLRRALIGPFASRLDAEAFCAKAASKGLACLVRRDASGRETTAPWPDGTFRERSTSPTSPPTPPTTSP
jgi:hypothetical protein